MGLESDAAYHEPANLILEAINTAAATDVDLSAEYRLAYDLWAASQLRFPVDVSFVLLSTALEVLINQQEPTEAAKTWLDSCIDSAKRARLDQEEMQSLQGYLQELKKRESVRRAGARLARRLGDTQYGGTSPVKFFKEKYTLRSDLVHGKVPWPDISMDEKAELERFVRDLLILGTYPSGI